MIKTKRFDAARFGMAGLVAFAAGAATVAAVALKGVSAYTAGDCAAHNEAELRAATADASCATITLNKTGTQDKGIELSADYDGQGKTLQLGPSSYGLLWDTYGLDGQQGEAPGATATIKNVKIVANAGSKALINIDDVPTILENVTTDRTAVASDSFYAHIDVKDASSLTLKNCAAAGGTIVIDYSPAVATHNLTLTVDAASAAAIADPARAAIFRGIEGAGKITAVDATTAAFIANKDVLLFELKDGALTELDADAIRDLVSGKPIIAASSASGKYTFNVAGVFAIDSVAVRVNGRAVGVAGDGSGASCGASSGGADLGVASSVVCTLDTAAWPAGDYNIELTATSGGESAVWSDALTVVVAPEIAETVKTDDGRAVVIVADGADDEKVADLAEENEDFAGFLDKLDDGAVFLALSDRGSCDEAGCAVAVPLSGLEPNATYHLYHYDDEGNVEFVGSYAADATGAMTVQLAEFSGNVLTKNKITLASETDTEAEPNAPDTGVFAGVMSAAQLAVSAVVVAGGVLAGVVFIVRKGVRRK
jgi:hypothetical protein